MFSSYMYFKTQQTNHPIRESGLLEWKTKPSCRSTAEGCRYDSGISCSVFHCCFFPLHWILYTLPPALKRSHWNKFESLPHKTLCLFGHYSRSLLLPLSSYPIIVFLQFKHLSQNNMAKNSSILSCYLWSLGARQI